MGDRLEKAPTGRAKCRACGEKIDKDELRFGEEVPNAYGEGDTASVFWFHPRCAAWRRPERFVALAEINELPDRERLLADAQLGVAHPRLARLGAASRAPSGRARCQHCKELIAKDGWRLELSSFAQTGFFDPMGFIHAPCAAAYFEVAAPVVAARLYGAAPALDPELRGVIGG